MSDFMYVHIFLAESDMDKQVGDLGAQNPSDLDREMWAGEIEDEEEVSNYLVPAS